MHCVWRRFPVPVSSASDEDYDDDPPLKKLCVFLCMPQNAPEYTSEHQNFLGEHPPRVKDCRTATFSTSANNFAPSDKREVMYGPVGSISNHWLQVPYEYKYLPKSLLSIS